MRKIITFLLGVFVLLPAVAEDNSYIEDWNALELTQEDREEFYSIVEGNQGIATGFKPWFFAKEMVKICHQAREGMMAVYFSPTQYSESMDSYNRQLEKYATTLPSSLPRSYIGAFELVYLKFRDYSFQKSIINGMSFSAGNEECNKWRVALQLSELGF